MIGLTFTFSEMATKTIERSLFRNGYRLIYAVDEVGMGCLAGPVVVCAVAFEKGFYNQENKLLEGLKESKLLSPRQREKFFKIILAQKIKYKICYAFPKTIDRLNIYRATRQAMRRAILKLSGSCPSSPHKCSDYLRPDGVPSRVTPFDLKKIVLIDGKTKIKGLDIEQMPIIKGDRKIFAIACASIIAKVFRDKIMTRYAKKYPGYGFEKHKGYGTKYHQTQLMALGPCEIHRKSFRLTY